MTRLKALRKNRNETQEEMARRLGITRGAYANIENGRREPDHAALITLAEHFGVTIDYLLDHETKPSPAPEDVGARDAVEQEIIRMARTLDPARKKLLLRLAQAVVQSTDEAESAKSRS